MACALVSTQKLSELRGVSNIHGYLSLKKSPEKGGLGVFILPSPPQKRNNSSLSLDISVFFFWSEYTLQRQPGDLLIGDKQVTN